MGLQMTLWTASEKTFNPRVLGSNPSRLTRIPRVNVGSAWRRRGG